MFNFLDKTPGWLKPYTLKVEDVLPGAGSHLWSGIKSMTYSFTVTMIMTRGDYVEGLKSAGIAAYAESSQWIVSSIFYHYYVSEKISFDTLQNGSRVASFCLVSLAVRKSIDLKVSAAATIIPFILSKVCHAQGLMVYGMIKA